MIELDCRELRGKAIARLDGQISRLGVALYQVKSQSGNGWHFVRSGRQGWECSCPDHVYREVKCKHIWACQLSAAIRKRVEASAVTIQPITTLQCPACSSETIVKDALRHNKYGNIQRYLCKSCGKRFSFNIGFERMKASPQAISSSMQLYFTGESLRNVQKFLRLQGVQVSHVAVYKWIQKYTELMEKYLSQITPQVSDTWRADELYVKIKGDMKYLFAVLDDETRFWIAQEVANSKETHDARQLFKTAKEVAGKKPKTLITDGLHTYQEAYTKEFWTRKREGRTEHIRHIVFKGDHNNNKMERFNGEIRDREKVIRGLKKPDTQVLKGYQIYHNYIRPHEALEGKTPAELAGIKVEGKDKWLTIIQNASKQTRQVTKPLS